MAGSAALLDTVTLSEVMKGRDPRIGEKAEEYLKTRRRFTFSIITRYEILRGLKAKDALRQIERFEEQCRTSIVLPLTDEVVVREGGASGGGFYRPAIPRLFSSASSTSA